MHPFKRSQRLESEIKRCLAEILSVETKDPRLSELTILDVKVTADLRRAKVYFSSFKKKDQVLNAFLGAKGYLRTELAHRLDIKYVPDLSFHFVDSSVFNPA